MLWVAAAIAVAGHTMDVAASDRDQIALVLPVNGSLQLAVVDVDGGAARVLTSGPGSSVSPGWSPDGRFLLYVHRNRGMSHIYRIRPDGSGKRRLTRSTVGNAFPGWSADGRALVFAARDGPHTQIFVMGADGSSLRRLTSSAGDAAAPVWSPDGRHIAYVMTPPGGTPELHVITPDGSRGRRLAAGLLIRPGILHPAWSPDGRQIAFVERVGRAEQQIAVISIDGIGYRRFGTGYAPAWSPDGLRIAFVVARVGDAQIYAGPVQGKPSRLTPSGTNLLPAWSPNGRRIAFVSFRDRELALWVMNGDGNGQRRLAPISGDLSALPVMTWRPR